MVMATNSIAAIDPALLLPARFDLIIPVGGARTRPGGPSWRPSSWRRGTPRRLSARTAGFTPADFASVAQRSAQLAFDRALAGGEPPSPPHDCLEAVSRTKPSVTQEAAAAFDHEGSSLRPTLRPAVNPRC